MYGIRNLVNGKIYVGRTKDFKRRCEQYVYDFNTERIGHLNPYLLASMRKHGISAFEMFPLEFCEDDAHQERELYWIKKLKSTNRDFGYNLRMDVAGVMRIHPETSKRISENLKTQWASGVRSGHSEKMKKRRVDDTDWAAISAKTLRKALTKYNYHLYSIDGSVSVYTYSELKDEGHSALLSAFFRKKSDSVSYKGMICIREAVCE